MTDEEKKQPEGGGYWSGRLLILRLALWALIFSILGVFLMGS